MKYPDPNVMFTAKSQGGIEIEGRKTRRGSSSMKIGTYTRDWTVSDVHVRQIQPEGMPFTVNEYNYKVKVTSFVPLVLLGNEIKRYETVGWWQCSYQEILRHLQLGTLFTEAKLWKSIMDVIDSSKEDLYDIILGYYDLILSIGDDSDAQWEYYVKEHEKSATPFDDVDYWGKLLDSSKRLNTSKYLTMDWEKKFNKYLHGRANTINTSIPHLVKAQYTYPGFRSRPADYSIIQEDDYSRVVLCKKWRDRKVGGIPGMSQSTWRIYKNKTKESVESYLTDKMRKVSGLDVSRLSQLKLDGYLRILNEDWNLYDMKTAEKQTGLAFAWTGFACDLGSPKFDEKLAAEMYSGIGPTSPLNELFMSIILRVIKEDEQWDGSRVMYFSDNLAVDVPLPEQVFLEPATEFCGLNKDTESFGPVSLTTDNPKHRLRFNGKWQRQVQSIQYLMRPMLACIMNGIGGRDVTRRFLEWAKDRSIFVEDEGERKDYLVDEVMKNIEIHKDIRQDFSEIEEFVKKYWYVQVTDADFSTNMRVSD